MRDKAVDRAKRLVDSMPCGDHLVFAGVPITEFNAGQLRRVVAVCSQQLEAERELYLSSESLYDRLHGAVN